MALREAWRNYKFVSQWLTNMNIKTSVMQETLRVTVLILSIIIVEFSYNFSHPAD
jgi:hypothetical protein